MRLVKIFGERYSSNREAQVVALAVFFISLGTIIYKMTRRDTTEELPNPALATGADKENP